MNSIDGFISEKSLYQRVAGITAPTTIIFGEQEQRIDVAAVAGYSSTGADVITIAEAGHTPTWERPEKVARALRATAAKTT
jgi:pimeloyl-ACP methyl ester carboxylesterase